MEIIVNKSAIKNSLFGNLAQRGNLHRRSQDFGMGRGKQKKTSNRFIISDKCKKKNKNINYNINIVNVKQTKKSNTTMAIFQQFYIVSKM